MMLAICLSVFLPVCSSVARNAYTKTRLSQRATDHHIASNTVIGTLAVDGRAVTFVSNVTAHPQTASAATSDYSM